MANRDAKNEAQSDRIDAAARNFLEDLFAGKASILVEPLKDGGDVGEQQAVGAVSITLLRGFRITLQPGR